MTGTCNLTSSYSHLYNFGGVYFPDFDGAVQGAGDEVFTVTGTQQTRDLLCMTDLLYHRTVGQLPDLHSEIRISFVLVCALTNVYLCMA